MEKPPGRIALGGSALGGLHRVRGSILHGRGVLKPLDLRLSMLKLLLLPFHEQVFNLAQPRVNAPERLVHL